MAHVALLHTDMNSGFKFDPKIGMKSPAMRTEYCKPVPPIQITWPFKGETFSLTNARFDVLKTRFGQIPKQRETALSNFRHWVLQKTFGRIIFQFCHFFADD